MQRAHPAQSASTPAHGFGPGEIADGGFQHLGDNVSGRAARLFDDGKVDLPLFIIAHFQIVARHTGTAQETFDRLVRRIHAGAFAFLAEGGAFGQDTFD